jgi:hypothetical protein
VKQNFNLVAIILVLAIDGLIIGLGLTVDSCVGSCQQRWKKGVEREQQWLHDGTLQLQRLAYEGRGFDGWMDAMRISRPWMRRRNFRGLQVLCKTGMGMLILVEVLMGISLRI